MSATMVSTGRIVSTFRAGRQVYIGKRRLMTCSSRGALRANGRPIWRRTVSATQRSMSSDGGSTNVVGVVAIFVSPASVFRMHVVRVDHEPRRQGRHAWRARRADECQPQLDVGASVGGGAALVEVRRDVAVMFRESPIEVGERDTETLGDGRGGIARCVPGEAVTGSQRRPLDKLIAGLTTSVGQRTPSR